MRQTGLGLLLALLSALALTGDAGANTFALTAGSPTNFLLASFASDLLNQPATGVGPVSAPMVLIGGSQIGLGASDAVTCLSYGRDVIPSVNPPPPPMFSVFRSAAGVPPFAVAPPSVSTEAVAPEAYSDVFVQVLPAGFNRQFYDGDGLPDPVYGPFFTLPLETGLGLIEGSPLLQSQAMQGDDIAAFDYLALPNAPTVGGVYFCLDAASPALLTAANPQLQFSVGPEDVFIGTPGVPTVFLHGETLGLAPTTQTVQGDEIDGMAFDSTANTLLFSLSASSTSIGQNDSKLGKPIAPGDVLSGIVGGAVTTPGPAIEIPAERLFLVARRNVIDDELSALSDRQNLGAGMPGFPSAPIAAVLDGASPSLATIPATTADILRIQPTSFGAPMVSVAISAAQMGLQSNDVIDALAFGVDTTTQLAFAVDFISVGFPNYFGGPSRPDVTTEGGGCFEASSDVFAEVPPAVANPLQVIANTQVFDGDGAPCAHYANAFGPFGFGSPLGQLGLVEGVLGTLQLGDQIAALDMVDPTGIGAGNPIYLSLSNNSPSLAALGATGSDVLVTFLGSSPSIAIGRAQLGLDVGGNVDDLDALYVAPQPGNLLFSVKRGSSVIGAGDSQFGIPITTADVLTFAAIAGITPPRLFRGGENLGLLTKRSAAEDDLNALSMPQPNTAVGSPSGVTPVMGVSVTFPSVTTAGWTTATSTTSNPQPGNFTIGSLGTYVDISTTAAHGTPINVILSYNPQGLTLAQEQALRLYHLQGTTWVDITDPNVSPNPDTIGKLLHGVAPHLSFFTAGSADTDGDGVVEHADTCPGVADPAQTDGDGDGIGDACDACPAFAHPSAACAPLALQVARFTFKKSTGAADDKLVLKGRAVLDAEPDPLGAGLGLRIREPVGGVDALDVALPAGAFDATPTVLRGWTVNKKGTVYTYKAKLAGQGKVTVPPPGNLTLVKLKDLDAAVAGGLHQVIVKGRNLSLDALHLPGAIPPGPPAHLEAVVTLDTGVVALQQPDGDCVYRATSAGAPVALTCRAP